jgi:hypothetical protein
MTPFITWASGHAPKGALDPNLMALEKLHCSFVFLGGAARLERPEIPSFASFRVFLTGEQSIFA